MSCCDKPENDDPVVIISDQLSGVDMDVRDGSAGKIICCQLRMNDDKKKHFSQMVSNNQ